MKKLLITIFVLVVLIDNIQSQDFTIGRLNGSSGLAICGGENVTFQAAISATSYTWYINGNQVSTDHPEIPQAQVFAKDNWSYAVGTTIRCIAQTATGSKTSYTLTTTTCVPPVLPSFTVGITILPERAAKIYCATENVTFRAEPSHSWSTILWYKKECSSCETLNVGGGLNYDPSTLDDDDLISVVAYPSNPANFQNSSSTSFVPIDILVIRGLVSVSAFNSNLPSLERCQGPGAATNFSASIVDYDNVTWTIQNVANPSGLAPGIITWNPATPQTASVSWSSEFVGDARIAISATGCGGTASAPPKTITVKPSSPSPTISLSGPSFICSGNGGTFLASGTNLGSNPLYTFTINGTNATSFDDGDPSTPLPPSYVLAMPNWNWINEVPVKVIVENRDQCVSGNRTAESNIITVYNSLNGSVNITGDNSRCQGSGTSQFSLSTNGNIQTSYVWDLGGGGGGSSITQNGLVTWDPLKYGEAYISVRPTGCSSTSIVKPISILPGASALSNQSISACNWEYITLKSNITTGSVNWYKNSQLLSTGLSLPLGYLHQSGNYTYEVEPVSEAGCKSLTKASIQISVSDNCDNDLNWIETKVLGENGLPITHSKQYYDFAGNALQSQSKRLQSNKIFIAQSIKDRYERSVASTLPAPGPYPNFNYHVNFAKSQSSTPYNYADFDNPAGANTVINPIPFDESTPGTVGWYYSANNNWENFVPTTRYPYSRSEFYSDGADGVKRSASAGNAHRLGAGHEVWSGAFPVYSELNDYLIKYRIALPEIPQTESLVREGVQSVGRDENGTYFITISDKNGKSIMTCRPGTPTDNTLAVTNSISVYEGGVGYESSKYFYLSAKQAVTISGGANYIIEDIVNDIRKSPGQTFADGNGYWPAGFYKITNNSTTSVALTYTSYFKDVSYSFYDAAGRIKVSVSPNGYKKWIQNPSGNYSSIDKTLYNYNHRGWLLDLTEPDAGKTSYKYRSDGSIRFSQNAQQLINQSSANDKGKFSYTNYDQSGRPVESGEYKGNAISFSSLINKVEFPDQIDFVNGDKKDWIKTYYDIADTSIPNLPSSYKQEFVRGAVSSTENTNIRTWYSYDESGRVTWMAQKPTALSRMFLTEYTYDFSGNVLSVRNTTYFNSTVQNIFYHHYEYDKDQRLIKAYTSTDGVDKKMRANYLYYLHGPLKRIELGERTQGIDFIYNINGWLTQINHPNVANDPGHDGVGNGFRTDAFGMTLDYYESTITGLFPTANYPLDIHNPLRIHRLPQLEESDLTVTVAKTNSDQMKALAQSMRMLRSKNQQDENPTDN